MSFASLTFFAFLAVVFGAYHSIRRHTLQNALLVVSSYAFYAWWDYRFCSLMLISSVVDYLVARRLPEARGPFERRALLTFSLLANIGLLGFFKYFDFFQENFIALFAQLGLDLHPSTLRIVLPVGISFYTFQTLGYVLDVWRGRLSPCRDLLSFLAFVCFFPQLVAGPIERAARMLPQFTAARSFDASEATFGCRLILWGLLKKMLIADNLGAIVDTVYREPTAYSGAPLLMATVLFAIQIYADFSAYSDIAAGTARLFGIRLMRNFDYPYFATSLSEFWRRWHISLSTWFRDYVYIPLGGRQTGRVRQTFNLMATFLLSGLWHGASWNFVVWGGLNGMALIPSNVFGFRPSRWLPAVLNRLAVFAFISLTWVFFRAATLPDALHILGTIATGFGSLSACLDVLGSVTRGKTTIAILLVFLFVEWLSRERWHPLTLARVPRWTRWAVYSALVWTMVLLGTLQSGSFIYFQF